MEPISPNNQSFLDIILGVFRNYRREILQIYGLGLLYAILSFIFPVSVQLLINFIQGAYYSVSLYMIISLATIALIFAAVLQIHQFRIIEYIEQKLFHRYSFEFVRKFPLLDYISVMYKIPRDMANRFFDMVSIQKSVQKILIDFSFTSIQIVLGFIILIFYHPVFLGLLLIISLILYIAFKLTFYQGLDLGLRYSKYKYDISFWIEEVSEDFIAYKLAGRTDHHFKTLDELMNRYLKMKNGYYDILEQQYIVFNTIKIISILFFLIAGSVLVIEQKMNLGEFVASEIIISLLISSFDKVIILMRTIYELIVSYHKINEVLAEKEEDISSTLNIVENFDEGIEINFRNVTVKDQENKIILDDIDLHIKSNEKILIVGDDFNAKAAFLRLCTTLIRPSEGEIYFNRKPLISYNIQNLRYHIGSFLNHDYLFKGKIIDNITLGRPNTDLNFILHMADKIDCISTINRLPKGFDTEILSHGVNFSDTMVNKLLFLRAVCIQPKLLVFENLLYNNQDDDIETFLNIITDSANYHWTLICSSKNSKYKKYFDRVVYFKDGKIDLIEKIN